MLTKIISGGQTGAGKAALDVTIEFDIPHGGWISTGSQDIERKTQHLKEIELKRFREPQEVSGLALFLASDASSIVTGEIIRGG
jgi:NAD(P)-dependent dehydrogenase (short-subunit alcohol dehydrogenase family)